MRTFKRLGAVTIAAMAMAMVACGGSPDAAGGGAPGSQSASALTFEAAATPLSSFKFDTGLIPEGSPAQVQLTLSAGGGLAIEAAAEPSGGALAGKPGGGMPPFIRRYATSMSSHAALKKLNSSITPKGPPSPPESVPSSTRSARRSAASGLATARKR